MRKQKPAKEMPKEMVGLLVSLTVYGSAFLWLSPLTQLVSAADQTQRFPMTVPMPAPSITVGQPRDPAQTNEITQVPGALPNTTLPIGTTPGHGNRPNNSGLGVFGDLPTVLPTASPTGQTGVQ